MLVEGAVGSVFVVVGDVVGDDAFELPAVPDEAAVEQFAADGSDPALAERVRHRRPHGSAEDLEVFAAEDLVERDGELAGAVADERSAVVQLVGVAEEQVAGRLCGPCAGRVRGDASEEHLAGVDPDEEQQVVAA